MKSLLLRMIREDDGVLSFEWVIMITIIVIGLVVGIAAARDGIVDELGDAAEAMVALDQSFYVDFPLQPQLTEDSMRDFDGDGVAETTFELGAIGGASNSGFEDFAVAYDCTRGENAAPGQNESNDED